MCKKCDAAAHTLRPSEIRRQNLAEIRYSRGLEAPAAMQIRQLHRRASQEAAWDPAAGMAASAMLMLLQQGFREARTTMMQHSLRHHNQILAYAKEQLINGKLTHEEYDELLEGQEDLQKYLGNNYFPFFGARRSPEGTSYFLIRDVGVGEHRSSNWTAFIDDEGNVHDIDDEDFFVPEWPEVDAYFSGKQPNQPK